MKLIRKAEPDIHEAAPEPAPAVAKADPIEAVVATLERVEEANGRALNDLAMVNKAVATALNERTADAPKPTKFRCTVTERDDKGRLKAFVIEVK